MTATSGRPTAPPAGARRVPTTAAALLAAPDRLLTPLVRARPGAPLCPADWDSALDLVAARLRDLAGAHGPDAVAVLGSGGLTNENAYALGKFARLALGTPQFDHGDRFGTSAAVTRALGVDRGLPFPVGDLAAADAILLAGANVAETAPLRQHLTRTTTAGGLVVVDPRRTAMAERATLHLQPVPDTGLVLALGLLHIAVVEGHVDHRYVERRTRGLTAAWRLATRWWPERVAEVTGVPVALQRAAVRLLAGADRAFVLTGCGADRPGNGTDTVSAYLNVALALGLPGRGGSGFGAIPDAGRAGYALLDGDGTADGPRGLLVFGGSPVGSALRGAHEQERLAALDLLVVAGVMPAETIALAHVVLPMTQWTEDEGTVTALDGRVLRRRRAAQPPPGPRTDLEVLHGLAVRLGQPPERFPVDPRAVFEELRHASADYAGITYERLDAGEELHWPCPATPPGTPPHRGTPRLFLTRFATPDGRARFVPVDHRPAAEEPDNAGCRS